MKLTNRLNLPEAIVRAVANDPYDAKSDYTTTGLIRPPRIAALLREHGASLTEDVSDRIWSLFGQVVHTIIERAAVEELVEKRLFMTVADKTVSGQVDIYHGKTLWDWKTCSIYSTKDGIKDEWIQQGNINALLCAENDIVVEDINYVALYRDFSIMASSRKQEYPESAVEVFKIPLWPLGVTRQFVEERIRLHEAAKEELPLCTEEDRWAKPEKWALMRKGQKRAVKLYDSEEQAEAATGDDKKLSVEHRHGESTRCLYFCPVSGHCTQFRHQILEGPQPQDLEPEPAQLFPTLPKEGEPEVD